MKNQLQTAITQRDRAVQVALNFVGHHISSSDGSYDLLKECVCNAIREAYAEGAADERKACQEIANAERSYRYADDGARLACDNIIAKIGARTPGPPTKKDADPL